MLFDRREQVCRVGLGGVGALVAEELVARVVAGEESVVAGVAAEDVRAVAAVEAVVAGAAAEEVVAGVAEEPPPPP